MPEGAAGAVAILSEYSDHPLYNPSRIARHLTLYSAPAFTEHEYEACPVFILALPVLTTDLLFFITWNWIIVAFTFKLSSSAVSL